MSTAPDATITVGDRQFAIPFRLLNPDGTLATLTAATLRMVNVADNSVKIAAGAVTITSFTFGGLVCNARYSFAAADVDTAGTYAIQVTDTTAGLLFHWPAGTDYLLEIKPVIGT
jgi:hypothetical protein